MPTMLAAGGSFLGSAGGQALLGGALGAGGSLWAGNIQANSARDALRLQQQIYQQNSGNLMPWITRGQAASGTLAGLYSDPGAGYSGFLASPEYQAGRFGYDQGQLGIERQLAASGRLGSGAIKGLDQFRADYSTGKFNDYFAHLNTLSEAGRAAASSLAGTGPSFANSMGNSTLGIGQAMGSGLSGAGNNLMGGLANYAFLNRLNPNSSYGPTPTGINMPMPGSFQGSYSPQQFQDMRNGATPGVGPPPGLGGYAGPY